MRWLAVVVLVLLAGCSSSSPPEARFPDADFRFSGNVAEGFEQVETLNLTESINTIMVSVETEDGFAVFLQAPPTQEPWSGQMMPGPRNGFGHQGPATIHSLQYTTVAGEPGPWTLQFGCNGPCRYTVAVNNGDTVAIPDTFTPKQSSPLAQGTLQDDNRQHYPALPALSPVKLSMDFVAEDAISMEFRDPDGTHMGGWNFQKVLAIGWEYQSLQLDAEPGEWELAVGCNGQCQYALGVS